jgi:hypothetical protein
MWGKGLDLDQLQQEQQQQQEEVQRLVQQYLQWCCRE